MKIKLQKTADGRTNLHIWRTGQSYHQQKSALFLAEWTNMMFSLLPHPPGDLLHYYDIRKPLPFADQSFDAIYAFHIIEHLTLAEARQFVEELNRILKPGGICRLSTPNLEDICREYLNNLQQCQQDSSRPNLIRYDWGMLELYDQLVREKSGGMMAESVKSGYYDAQYAHERYGDVFAEFYSPAAPPEKNKKTQSGFPSLWSARFKIFFNSPKKAIAHIYWDLEFIFFKKLGEYIRRRFRGDPRKTMEGNKWAYDRLSLRLLMEKCGFKDIRQKTFAASDIQNWEKYNFDKSNLGDHAVEPSLYMEGRK